ncbi:MAG: ClbS/DfsB family four-helix bundle protein [Anaerolineae bacterium]|nr:ClbS/DfsB family four-helix bundle protein [Anaerolineae bacterium]
MDESITKTKIFESIQQEREALQVVLDQLTVEQMTQPGVEGDWSVKDILAHISTWEQKMVQWLEESLRGKELPAPYGVADDQVNEINQQIYLANKNRSLAEILAEFEASYQQALQTVESLTEDDLVDPHRFAWRRGEPMWHLVAANTWWHYREHRESISNWLAGNA